MAPLRTAILGGVAVLALSMGAALAAAGTTTTTTTTDNGRTERRVVIVRDDNGRVETYDSADEGHGPMILRRDHSERMAEHLRAVLQLTPAQEPALQSFLAAMKPGEHAWGDRGPRHEEIRIERRDGAPADPAARKAELDKHLAEMKARMAELEKKRAEEAALTTPQKLDRMVARAAEESARRQAALQAHVNAVKTFYVALTPAQQKAFDALHEGMGFEGMGHEGFGPHGGHGDWDGGPHMEIRRLGMMAPTPPLPPLPPEPPLPPPPPPPPPGER